MKKLLENYKILFVLLLICLGLAFYLFINYAPDKSPFTENSHVDSLVIDNGIIYLNTAKNVKYMGSVSCYPCHRSTSRYWRKAQMSRSMEIMSDTNIVEIYPQIKPVYDKINDYYYDMIKKGGKFYQREYRKNIEGKIIHERLMQAEYSMGSGNNLRMYFYNENGMFYQLPLTWYSHKKAWDLSPGFRDYKNLRFSRYATKKCVFCHNSYMHENPKAFDRFLKPYEIGISCERCHGPGELHVKEENEDLPDSVRTIVNPKNLSLDRQMSICMQCHLEGKAWVLQKENGWFDFRPGQLLSTNRSVYYPASTSKEAIEVGDTPHRLMLSKCYTGSNGKLTCISCHDPHKSIHTFTKKHYNDVCLSCHPSNKLHGISQKYVHKKRDDCIDCHMNKTGTENTLHGVSLTDHWIRVGANKTKIDWDGVRHPEIRPLIKLVAEITKNDSEKSIRKGIAYYEYRSEYDDRSSYLDSALAYLIVGLQKVKNSYRGYFYLGKVYYDLGRKQEALSAFNNAIEINKNLAKAYFNAGKIYKEFGNKDEAINSFKKALSLKPYEPSFMESLGVVLYDNNMTEASLKYLLEALKVDNQNPYTYFNIGNIYALKLNMPEKALEYFKQAVYLDPDIQYGYLNLGNTFALVNNYIEAIKAYNLYIYKNPKATSAYINLGHIYEAIGKTKKAKVNYEKALKIQPGSKIVIELLNNLK